MHGLLHQEYAHTVIDEQRRRTERLPVCEARPRNRVRAALAAWLGVTAKRVDPAAAGATA